MKYLEEIKAFIGEIGYPGVTALQPLAQWSVPTAFRVYLEGRDEPKTIIVKHISSEGNVAKTWSPVWKIAQDYVNLEFLASVGAGGFVPACYGYSQERNMIAIEDLGTLSLEDVEQVPHISQNRDLWCSVATRLATLSRSCPTKPQGFTEFCTGKVTGFTVLERWHPESISSTILRMTRHIDCEAIDRLEEEVLRLSKLAIDSDLIGYATGDLWHDHIVLQGEEIKFIDFHCGGYDLCITDLVRLVEGTPISQGRSLESELKAKCIAAFREIILDQTSSHEAFDQVYSLGVVRQALAKCRNTDDCRDDREFSIHKGRICQSSRSTQKRINLQGVIEAD